MPLVGQISGTPHLLRHRYTQGHGESSTIGAPPTVINALIDALEPLGVDHIDMPATPARVWETITRARAGAMAQPAA